MQDKPGPTELLAAVAHFLRDELLPTLTAHHAFQLRVSCNALDLVARQLAQEPAANAAEVARLTKLLGHGGELGALNAELASAVADGKMTLETPGLKDHLWATTLAKLSVDQPQYGSYKRECARETK
ncbi:MAG: hypothetical protein KGM42_09175 [Hyphomicrobiales bacterium]|nr:hypothetical protein [Hyphomicrobiales bacterium]